VRVRDLFTEVKCRAEDAILGLGLNCKLPNRWYENESD